MHFLYIEATCSCVGIHPERVELTSPIELTTSRTEAPQAQRSCASSQEIITQCILLRKWPMTRGPERSSRSALIVVAHAFSWPPVRLRGLGRRGSVSNLERPYLPSKEHKRNDVVGGVLCLSLVTSL